MMDRVREKTVLKGLIRHLLKARIEMRDGDCKSHADHSPHY